MNEQLVRLAEKPTSGAAIMGVVLAVAYFFFVAKDATVPVDFDIKTETEKLQVVEKKLKDTKAKVAESEKFKKEVDELNQELQTLLQYMPPDLSITDFLETVQNEARVAGAIIKSVKPDPKTEKVDFYEINRIGLSLEGSYAQITLFLSALTKLERMYTFEKADVTRSGGEPDSPKVSFQGTLVAYRYLPTATAAPGAGPSNAPGAPAAAGAAGGNK